MKDIKDKKHFRDELESNERVCALFYASWCPYSRRFLPDFDAAAHEKSGVFTSVKVDDIDDLCDEYDINVYPSVIFFERGEILERLDGTLGRGLAGHQLSGLIEKCASRERKK